jgi:hypothetical protein
MGTFYSFTGRVLGLLAGSKYAGTSYHTVLAEEGKRDQGKRRSARGATTIR